MTPSHILFGLLFAVFLLFGCITTAGFDDQFAQSRAILERNGAFFPHSLTPPSVFEISRAQLELSAFAQTVSRQPDSPDRRAMTAFLDTEQHLLEMQRQFLLGNDAFARVDFAQISCEPTGTVAAAISHYDLAVARADIAMRSINAFRTSQSDYAIRTSIDWAALETDVSLAKTRFAELKTSLQRFCS